MSEASDPQSQQPEAGAGAGGQPPAYGGGVPASRGPLGVPRGPAIVVLLSIVTLGIYYLYWVFRSQEDVKDYSGQGVGGLIGLLIALFCGIVTPFLMGSEIANMYQAEGRESPVTVVTGFWIFLPLVGSIVWQVKTQGALNEFWEAHGAPAPG